MERSLVRYCLRMIRVMANNLNNFITMEEFLETRTMASMIQDAMKAKNITTEKLSQLTGISERFLEALTKEGSEKLPAAPYVRGYLAKIASVLNLDGDALWSEYSRQYVRPKAVRKISVNESERRFEMLEKFVSPRSLVIIGAILGIGLIIWLRGSAFIGRPTLSLEQFDDNAPTATSTFVIKGKIDPKNQLTINDEVVFPDDTGTFEKNFVLTPGFNTFHFKVKGILGKELDITKQVYLTTSTKRSEKQVEKPVETTTTTQQ